VDDLFADKVNSYHSRGETVASDEAIVYFVQEGYVGLYSNTGNERRLLFVYKKGDIFPFAMTSNIYKNREYTHIAISRLTLTSMPRKEFELAAQDPRYFAVLFQYLQQIMQLQFERIDNLQKFQVLERLLERLWFITKRVGVNKDNKITIDVPMSHVDLATSIGTSRETVNRYMKQLEAEGILTVKRQKITILAPAKLEEALRQKQLPLKRNWGKMPVVAVQTGLALQGAIAVYNELN
jgi:CRP/FNR family cyclic AMP-dependent transcriptional regulator